MPEKNNNRWIHWFRQDLRIQDNPALSEAALQGDLIVIYILDDINAQDVAMGGASRWWLHQALAALNEQLHGKLRVFKGDAAQIIQSLCDQLQPTGITWNRCYEPWRIHRDSNIKQQLKQRSIDVISCNGSLLWEPWQNLKKDNTPYRVFTPFFKHGCLKSAPPRYPLPAPASLTFAPIGKLTNQCNLEDLALIDPINWHSSIEQHWQPTETAAREKLDHFVKQGINHYKIGRDFPAKPYVSSLSPYLHFGQISPNQAWYSAKNSGDDDNTNTFLSELGWREFSYSLLYHFPDMHWKNLQSKFDKFAWQTDSPMLQAWQHGNTGYPIVDAGMRQLWQTGTMHNRVRMIVASFLVKNLLIHWHLGAAWFWDCLCDADLASNSASWQWVAGCGADAAPYFRIFNPVTQGEKFDPDGDYTRHYVPEIAALPNKYLFQPWKAPEEVLKAAKITLGETYAKPIVDLKESRERALSTLQQLKDATPS